MRSLTTSSARTLLTVIWIGCFIIAFAIVLYLYLDHWIERDTLFLAVKQLSDLYAPYVGAITLFYWGSRVDPAGSAPRRASTGSILALIVSLLWNVLVLAFLVPLLFGSGTVHESVENMRDIVGVLSWLVGGAIGYYFARPTASAQHAGASV